MRFELTRAEPNGIAVHRLNHSATLSMQSHNIQENNFEDRPDHTRCILFFYNSWMIYMNFSHSMTDSVAQR